MASAAPYTSSPARPALGTTAPVSGSDILRQLEDLSLDMDAAAALLESIDCELNERVMSDRGELLIVAMRSVMANARAKMSVAVGDMLRAI